MITCSDLLKGCVSIPFALRTCEIPHQRSQCIIHENQGQNFFIYYAIHTIVVVVFQNLWTEIES